MKKVGIRKNILENIGNTPLLSLNKLLHQHTSKTCSNLYAKCEYQQPGGSLKDRAAYQIIKDAYLSKSLHPNQPVIEMTSGNMGAGLAVVCNVFGNPFIATMSEGNSPERRKFLEAMGAEVILVPQVSGSPGQVTGDDIQVAVEKAKELATDIGGFYVDQFYNPSCVSAHYNTTGPEIWNDLSQLNAFVAGIGTAGSFIGTSKYLKGKNKDITCIAVEPVQASILKSNFIENPKHIIQGIGYSLIPPHWLPDLANKIIGVSDEQVKYYTEQLALVEGVYVGYSSGANVAAAIEYLNHHCHGDDVTIVTLLCDTGYKYSF